MSRRITIPRYRALQAHWRRHPRPEWLIAGYLGYKPIAPARSASQHRDAPAQRAHIPRPNGAMLNLFNSLGGQPGKTVVMNV